MHCTFVLSLSRMVIMFVGAFYSPLSLYVVCVCGGGGVAREVTELALKDSGCVVEISI